MVQIENAAAFHFRAWPLGGQRRKVHSPINVISGYCWQDTPPCPGPSVFLTLGAKVIQLDYRADKEQIVKKSLVVLIDVALVCHHKSKSDPGFKPHFRLVRRCDYTVPH
jgi:hypothetical protein